MSQEWRKGSDASKNMRATKMVLSSPRGNPTILRFNASEIEPASSYSSASPQTSPRLASLSRTPPCDLFPRANHIIYMGDQQANTNQNLGNLNIPLTTTPSDNSSPTKPMENINHFVQTLSSFPKLTLHDNNNNNVFDQTSTSKINSANLTNTSNSSNPTNNDEWTSAYGVKRGSCTCGCKRYSPETPNGCCSCGHWPMKHKHLGKISQTIESILSDPVLFTQAFTDPSHKLVISFCLTPDFETSNNLTSLIQVLDYHDKMLSLVEFCVYNEIEAPTVRSNPNTVFREDKINVRIITQFIMLVGHKWLNLTFGKIIADICSKNSEFEIVTKENAAKKINVGKLSKLTRQIVQVLVDSLPIFPAKIALVTSIVEKVIKQKYPSFEIPAIVALIFLRFICPSLCAPTGFLENPEVKILPNPQRGLINAAKILQNMVLGQKFTPQDTLFEMNDLIEEKIPTLKRFLTSISGSVNSESLSWKATEQMKDEALKKLISFAKSSPSLLESQI